MATETGHTSNPETDNPVSFEWELPLGSEFVEGSSEIPDDSVVVIWINEGDSHA